ncbi:hypothetical protein GCM10007061_05580 [Kocuria marina]|uniref:TetR/AcrR family transcriptional regulator n=2 Tax=Micrococcaceae TaxID=1268 RepID=UPI001876D53A|nr:hypothetical protein GCM10007061_05580 [Kocuria marina]
MDRRIERTRAAVVEAAVELVARRGSQVGMTEIAQAAGVSRKAVYENFGSRDQVLLGATQSLLARLPLDPSALQNREASPLDLVLPPLVAHLGEHQEFYRAMLCGPGPSLARGAVAEHAMTGLRSLREDRESGEDRGVVEIRDRFVVHGLLGVLADALAEQQDADLVTLARVLNASLATGGLEN